MGANTLYMFHRSKENKKTRYTILHFSKESKRSNFKPLSSKILESQKRRYVVLPDHGRPGISLAKKLEAASVPPRMSYQSSSIKALCQMQIRWDWNRKVCRNRDLSARRRHCARRRQLYSLHKDLKGLSEYKVHNASEHNYHKKKQL